MPYFKAPFKEVYTPPLFSEGTDEEITEALEKHRNGEIDLSEYWSVGDTRDVHISAMSATGVGESNAEQDAEWVVLHGKDMFDLVDGGKNIFVIGLKDILYTGGYINTSNTNVGGWKDCLRRPWCDNVFMPALPTECQKWFKKFKYKVGKGNTSTELDELENYFTFASAYEVFESPTYTAPGEGTQFDWYKTADNRIKHQGKGGGASTWWLRSPFTGGTTTFRRVDSGGTTYSGSAGDTYGLSPFGCV